MIDKKRANINNYRAIFEKKGILWNGTIKKKEN